MQVVIGWTSMEKIKTHLVFPTALHIFNHKMEQEEQQIMVNYIKGTKNNETLDVAGLSKHTKNNLHKIHYQNMQYENHYNLHLKLFLNQMFDFRLS